MTELSITYWYKSVYGPFVVCMQGSEEFGETSWYTWSEVLYMNTMVIPR